MVMVMRSSTLVMPGGVLGCKIIGIAAPVRLDGRQYRAAFCGLPINRRDVAVRSKMISAFRRPSRSSCYKRPCRRSIAAGALGPKATARSVITSAAAAPIPSRPPRSAARPSCRRVWVCVASPASEAAVEATDRAILRWTLTQFVSLAWALVPAGLAPAERSRWRQRGFGSRMAHHGARR